MSKMQLLIPFQMCLPPTQSQQVFSHATCLLTPGIWKPFSILCFFSSPTSNPLSPCQLFFKMYLKLPSFHLYCHHFSPSHHHLSSVMELIVVASYLFSPLPFLPPYNPYTGSDGALEDVNKFILLLFSNLIKDLPHVWNKL